MSLMVCEIPYLEHDKTNPKSVYGLTKLQGEKEIIKLCKKYHNQDFFGLFIYGHNFVKTMLKLAKIKSELEQFVIKLEALQMQRI